MEEEKLQHMDTTSSMSGDKNRDFEEACAVLSKLTLIQIKVLIDRSREIVPRSFMLLAKAFCLLTGNLPKMKVVIGSVSTAQEK